VLDPLNPAIETAKKILFSPFDLSKWFAIGFCAWLCMLGQGAGGGFNFPFGGQGFSGGPGGELRNRIMENLPIVITVAIIIFILFVGFTALFLWLSSRGQFMFLDCVAQNKGQVKEPWRKFKQHAHSLFLFRLSVVLVGFVTTAVTVGIIVVLVTTAYRSPAPVSIIAIMAIITMVGIALLAGMSLGLVIKYTQDFVVPIMYLKNYTCVDAWREFLHLLAENKSQFLIYYPLFQMAIGLGIGVIVIIAIFATCCCAGAILMLPYLGTVLLLPILVFMRAYSLHYLRQFGPQYNVFSEQEMPPTTI